MVDGGPTTTLPRSLDARVRELLHLLSTAVFERKVAIANEFRVIKVAHGKEQCSFAQRQRYGGFTLPCAQLIPNLCSACFHPPSPIPKI